MAHERVFNTNPIVIAEPGYVYIYVSNENTTPVDVYFDDFKVTQTKSPVVQQDEYYPFGLTFNSYQRENSVPNDIKFQGQEHIDALGLNWDSFKWRNHQPDIGRFFNVDPLAEKYYYNSPYAFSENKVVAHRELEGLEAESIIKQEIKKVESAYNNFTDKIGKAINKLVSAITPKEQIGKTETEKKNSNAIPAKGEGTDGWQVKKTDAPSDLDGNTNPPFDPDATAKGGKDGDEVMTHEQGQKKIENPDKPSSEIKIDTAWGPVIKNDASVDSVWTIYKAPSTNSQWDTLKKTGATPWLKPIIK